VKRENDGHTRIFCFGIGTDVNTHLLDKITEETRAFSQYVLPEEDLEVKVSSFFSKIKEPVLANPSLKLTEDIRLTKLYPSPLPDLFKGEQLVLVGRYTGHGDSAVLIKGSVNSTSREFSYETRFPEENSENDFIPRLWATRRVGYLLDEIRLHGESSELRDEVTELARKYGIVTPYTAYLIIEDETRRDVPMPLRSMQSFEQDRAARNEAASVWQQFKTERGGDSGVADARSSLALKSADAPALGAMESGAAFMRRYGLASTAASAPSPSAPDNTQARVARYSQQSQFVGGKTFFQNDKQWIDSAIQKSPEAKRVRLQFGSEDYFNLLSKHPQAALWLALGQNIQVLLDGTIYDIYE
jgi:Ca-activated chloride channel family protein